MEQENECLVRGPTWALEVVENTEEIVLQAILGICGHSSRKIFDFNQPVSSAVLSWQRTHIQHANKHTKMTTYITEQLQHKHAERNCYTQIIQHHSYAKVNLGNFLIRI